MSDGGMCEFPALIKLPTWPPPWAPASCIRTLSLGRPNSKSVLHLLSLTLVVETLGIGKYYYNISKGMGKRQQLRSGPSGLGFDLSICDLSIFDFLTIIELISDRINSIFFKLESIFRSQKMIELIDKLIIEFPTLDLSQIFKLYFIGKENIGILTMMIHQVQKVHGDTAIIQGQELGFKFLRQPFYKEVFHCVWQQW